METVILWTALCFTAVVAAAVLRRDLRFALGRRRRVEAVVVGHERLHEDGSVVHSAVFAFTDHRGREHRVADTLMMPTRKPPLATRVTLVYPEAQPGLARVPRPLLRSAIYVAIAYLLAVLAARLSGWPA